MRRGSKEGKRAQEKMEWTETLRERKEKEMRRNDVEEEGRRIEKAEKRGIGLGWREKEEEGKELK